MIKFRVEEEGQAPVYMSALASGADLKSSISLTLLPGQIAKVPTGIWIESIDEQAVPPGTILELQIRARSGLAAKHGITMANGIGTVDADYREEICVLLINHGREAFVVNKGDRIAQLVANLALRLSGLSIKGQRLGGFGSTGLAGSLDSSQA